MADNLEIAIRYYFSVGIDFTRETHRADRPANNNTDWQFRELYTRSRE